MTDVQTDHDLRAGQSSMCRRDQHALCKSSGARCTCACHGSRGQTPPQPSTPTPIRKEPTMTDPVAASAPTPTVPPVKLVPSDPALEEQPVGYVCETCGKTFEKPQGLGAHRSRSHGYRAPAAKSKATKTPKPKQADPVSPPTAVPAPYVEPAGDPFIVVALHTTPGGVRAVEAVAVPAEWDAHELAVMLSRLGHRTFLIGPDADDGRPAIEEYTAP